MRKLIDNLLKKKTRRKKSDTIKKLIKQNEYQSYAEIGVWTGETFFDVVKSDPIIEAYGVDPYKTKAYDGISSNERMSQIEQDRYDEIFSTVCKKAKESDKHISILREPSQKAVTDFEDESLDIIFIDGLHDYRSVKDDIKAWLPKVRKGGILCGHDFNFRFFSVVKAVDDVLGSDNIEVDIYTDIWIYRKQG